VRVLLMEDDRRLAASVQRALAESGLAVDTVHDGTDGIAAIETTPYDVVVMDVMMPGLDGYEVSRQLRRQKVSTPILMLTARDAVDDRVRGLESGADDYMVKPFAMRELIARIRALARRHLPDRSAVLTAGPITLDSAAHTVTVGEREVELTAKEFAILDFFLHNPRRLLSRTQIIEHVWDYDFEGGHNLIEVYMGRLRRKLIGAGAGDPFVTVRGSGYRLEPRA
jgi:two-component system OmpR family response regulator